MTTSIPSKTTISYDSVKLGIDAHAKYYWVSRQLDGSTPQPVQKMTYDELLLFVVKQQKKEVSVPRSPSSTTPAETCAVEPRERPGRAAPARA